MTAFLIALGVSLLIAGIVLIKQAVNDELREGN